MQKYKIELLYDNRKDITNIFIWLGTRLCDTRTLNGQITKEHEDKIKSEIQSELIEK